jgi:hypothetical protein
MATATLPANASNRADLLADLMHMFGDVPADDLEIFKERMEKRAKVKELGAYHQIILNRVYTRPGRPKPELPGGVYESYQLMGGRHYRIEDKDLLAAQQEFKEKCDTAKSKGHNIPDFPELQQTEYGIGQTITPQNDGEALMMLQDPEKFRPLKGDGDKMAELIAENLRLQQDRDRAIAASTAQKDNEIAVLRQQLEEAKKGKK